MRPLRPTAAALACAAALAAAPGVRAQGFGGAVTDILVRGDLLIAQNRPNEAIIQFQDARTLCATPAETVHSLMGEAEARSLLQELLPAAGLYEEAAARFPEDPRVPDCLYRAGILRYRSGEVDRSIELLRRSIEHRPTPDLEPQAYFALGQALRARGRHAEVIEALQDFETRFPEHALLATVLYTRAMSEHDLGNPGKAEAIYRDILKRYAPPNMNQAYVEAHFEIGAVLAELGRKREAADYYRKYVGMNPTSPVAAAALERAGDCLLFRSPKSSAELYALARVKAAANPAPPLPALGLSRWIGAKRTAAEVLSRVWVAALIGTAILGGLAFGVRALLRRLRRARPMRAAHPDTRTG